MYALFYESQTKFELSGDSGEMPDNRCSNCIQYGYECTHKEVTKVSAVCPYTLPMQWFIQFVVTDLGSSQRVWHMAYDDSIFSKLILSYRYVESLEARLEKMDRLLSKVRALQIYI